MSIEYTEEQREAGRKVADDLEARGKAEKDTHLGRRAAQLFYTAAATVRLMYSIGEFGNE